MLEFAEVINISRQLTEYASGKKVKKVLTPTKVHKFCWFNGDVGEYSRQLEGCILTGANAVGIFVEMTFDNSKRLCINDGINVRLVDAEKAAKDYQLLILFEDGMALVFTVAMYGGIILHDGDYNNEYYLKSMSAISPFSNEFKAYYKRQFAACKQTISAKAFIATEQRFVGIGNGTAQDILFEAGINPKKKLESFTADEKGKLFEAIVSKLREITDKGGRDTEKDIFGECGGYKTLMSKNSLSEGCPNCKGEITKETFLGGSVYYCKHCQPLN